MKHIQDQGSRLPGALAPQPSQRRWSMVQGTRGDLVTVASGARATGQILKTINREGNIGVRSQSPGTMRVSSRNSGVQLLSCAPTCLRPLLYPSSSVGHIQSPGFGKAVGWQWSLPCDLPCWLGAPQPDGERSPEDPPTTSPHPNASPQRAPGCANEE